MGVFSEGEIRETMDNGASKGVKPQMFHMVPGNPLLILSDTEVTSKVKNLSVSELFDKVARGLIGFWSNDDKDGLIEAGVANLYLIDRLLDTDYEYTGVPLQDSHNKAIYDFGFGALPVRSLGVLAEHYGRGGKKYSPFNWTAGYKWSFAYDAAMRHLFSTSYGELTDEETGSLHLVAVAWYIMLLIEFQETHTEYDDRPVRGEDRTRNS